MPWIYKKFSVYPSERNGEVRLRRIFRSWEIRGSNEFQTTPYVTSIWRHALRRVRGAHVRRVLLLGFGGGGAIREIHKAFPGVQVTAIEWDPVMVELAHKIQIYPKTQAPHIIVGDAKEEIPKLKESFDLILCDLFEGSNPSAFLHQDVSLRAIKRVLAWDGFFILNAYRDRPLLEQAAKIFSCHKRWRDRYNYLALYRHEGKGNIGDVLPKGYRNFRATDEYIVREGSQGSPWISIGVPDAMGSRWHHGPLWFEGYHCDKEPVIEPFPHTRLITWQTYANIPTPPGWHRSWIQMNARLTGFAEIRDPKNYTEHWSDHAKRHLRRWQKAKPYDLVTVSLEEFIESYRKTSMDRWLKYLFIKFLRDKVKRHGERVYFFGARERGSGRLVAGFAAGDVPETLCSVHLASFVLKEAENTSVGVGMVDEWFRRNIEKGFRFVDFDLFWAPGDPRSWKGFSRFKKQFGLTFIRYPKPFMRIVWGQKD